MLRDAVSRTSNVERTARHKWVNCTVQSSPPTLRAVREPLIVPPPELLYPDTRPNPCARRGGARPPLPGAEGAHGGRGAEVAEQLGVVI